MNLGIFETGAPPADLKHRFGSYGDMFRQLLGPDYRYSYYDVREGQLPSQVDSHDAYLITGSSSGVYDGDPWIDALKTFVQRLSGRVPLVGICFGHQIMAEAYGGRVTQSPKGWGVGLHSYEINRRAAWMNGANEPALSIPVSHQDQIVELPEDAIVLASSAFTPYAVLEYPSGVLAGVCESTDRSAPRHALSAGLCRRRGGLVAKAQRLPARGWLGP
jgi:GMP synthase-like glutamine amidotransferase